MSATEPVIVGVGQVVHRPGDPAPGPGGPQPPDPAALMAAACARALADTGAAAQGADIDSLDVVNVFSWDYAPDAAKEVAKRLEAAPAHLAESPAGGEQPGVLVDRLAARIARGEVRAGLVTGAEAQASVLESARAGETLPWPARADRPGVAIENIVHPEAWRHGLRAPTRVYPLFENAFRADRGQTLDQGQQESAAVWALMSQVAGDNPVSWYPAVRSSEEIRTPGPRNRWICHPYPKLMNAAPAVNQAAAVLMTSRQTALSWGIPEERLVRPVAAAGARELRDPLARPFFHRSAAMEATLDAALERARTDIAAIDELEFYSCFPCVPKMAAAHLGIGLDRPLTVTGGLSFFGGPGNEYMLHAVVAMVERLRGRSGRTGLLYGQGEFVTKHHALVLRGGAGGEDAPYVDGTEPLPAQAEIDAAEGPPIDPEPDGEGVIETYTATYERDGSPGTGIVVGRLRGSGHRFVARTQPGDQRSFQVLTSGDHEPVGMTVRVRPGERTNLVTVDPAGTR